MVRSQNSLSNSPAVVMGQLLDGRYRITQVLAKGGFGQTYLAIDTRRPGEPLCVVKQLQPVHKNPKFLPEIHRLFNTEAEVLEKLGQHSQIPQLLAHFEENQEFYLVQEYIQGHSLSQEIVPRRPLSCGRVILLLQEILEILMFIHSRRVIHRDVKPDNLIRREADGKLVLIDFGAVKELTVKELNITTGMTQPPSNPSPSNPSIVIGTRAYMPIEQFSGYPQLNSDLYAAGVIGIQAASGLTANEVQPLLDPNNPETHTKNWRDTVSVTPEVVAILENMVHLDYMQRYQSAAAILADLDNLRADPTVILMTPAAAPSSPNPAPSTTLQPSQPDSSRSAPVALTHQVSPTLSALPFSPDRSDISLVRSSPSPRRRWLVAAGLGLGAALAIGITALPTLVDLPTILNPADRSNVRRFALARTLTAHKDAVWSVAFSPDSQTLASASEDATINLWNSETGQRLQTLGGHSDSIRSIALSADGQTLVSGSGDSTLNLWHLPQGELRQTLTGHTGAVWSVALSPDGQTLVSGGNDGMIKTWDVATGQLRHTLTGHTQPVYAVALSRDGQTLISGSEDQTIKVWQTQSGTLQRTLSGHTDAVRSVAFSPDGQTIASASWDKTVKLWDVQTGQTLRTLVGHGDRVVAVAFSPDGQTIASASIDQTVKVWQMQTGKLLDTLSGHKDWVLSLDFSPAGQTLVSGDRHGSIKVWQH